MRCLPALLVLLLPVPAQAPPQVSAGGAEHSAGRVWSRTTPCAGPVHRIPCGPEDNRLRRELARREMERRAREAAGADRRREREQQERLREGEARYRRRLEREQQEARRRDEARRREWWERERARRHEDRRPPQD